jgi:hypothetical protein
MVAQQYHLTFHDLIDTLSRVRAVTDNISKTVDLRDTSLLDVVKNSGHRF